MKVLRTSSRAYGACAALLLGVMSAPTQAATVKQPFESNILVTGADMHLAEFNLSKPGKGVIELADLKWPSLSDRQRVSFADATHVMQSFAASRGSTKLTWALEAKTPGTFYANIFAKYSATEKGAMHHGNIDCQPVAPVPLPGAAWLLMSGIVSLAAFRPKQKLPQV